MLPACAEANEEEPNMNILLWTDDLMGRVRIESRLTRAGARMLRRDEFTDAGLVAVDLQARDAVTQIRRIRSARPERHIVAYGPHVDGAAFKAAREAGADEVVAQGKVVERLLRHMA
jgi:DNA-binding NarL/FixJ family response regulator